MKFLNYDEAKKAFEEGNAVKVSGTLLAYDKNNKQLSDYVVSDMFPINRYLEWEIVE